MQLVDTHTHLFWDSYREDFAQVIQRSLDAGVNMVVNVGVDTKLSKVAAELDTSPLTSYSTIGIHPHEASKYSDKEQEANDKLEKDIKALEEIYQKFPQKVIGVGECGLDFLFESNPDWIPTNLSIDELKDLQRKLFKAQIELARKLDLPLIVHCRDDRTQNKENIECWQETLEMVKDYKGILHCYSGTMEITEKIPENFLVSFAGNITYPKNDYLREAVKFLPLEKILLETDCPFLAPQSKRGARNEPSSIKEIAHLIAELKETTLDQVASQTTTNFKNLFELK